MASQFQKINFLQQKRLLGIALVLLTSVILAMLLSYDLARADAGGPPTKTPTPSPTVTLTQTVVIYPLPDQIIYPTAPPELVTPVGTALPPKALPSDESLYATGTALALTLQATDTAAQQPPARSAGFWLYMLLLLGISAAVVAILFFSLWNRKKNPPPPGE